MKLSRILYPVLALLVTVGIVAGVLLVLRNRPIAVDIARPEKDVAIEVFGLGTVEARVVSKVSFEVASVLTSVTFDHGDSVKQGEVIALLDSAEQEARSIKAKAGIQAAEAALARSLIFVQRQAAVLAQKEAINNRQQELLSKGVAASEKAEETAKDAQVAESDHALALADVDVARSSVATAKAELVREDVLLQKHILRAPFDAIVVERHVEPGTAVKAGEIVYTLVDPASIWGLAYVEEARAGAIAVGQSARVRLRSRPGLEIAARVVRVGIESDRVSEERRVWVKCEQCPPSFHLGEQAEVIIKTGTLAEALLVPEIAVSGFDGHQGTVWIADKGVARRATLAFGSRTLDGRLAVADAVPDGASVITGPLANLREGSAVTTATENKP
jgi:HlyD family secretion protein